VRRELKRCPPSNEVIPPAIHYSRHSVNGIRAAKKVMSARQTFDIGRVSNVIPNANEYMARVFIGRRDDFKVMAPDVARARDSGAKSLYSMALHHVWQAQGRGRTPLFPILQ
jgi:hypothetical protein